MCQEYIFVSAADASLPISGHIRVDFHAQRYAGDSHAGRGPLPKRREQLFGISGAPLWLAGTMLRQEGGGPFRVATESVRFPARAYELFSFLLFPCYPCAVA